MIKQKNPNVFKELICQTKFNLMSDFCMLYMVSYESERGWHRYIILSIWFMKHVFIGYSKILCANLEKDHKEK